MKKPQKLNFYIKKVIYSKKNFPNVELEFEGLEINDKTLRIEFNEE